MMLQHALVAFSIAAILAPFSYYAGQAAKHLKLPQITGYLLSGIVCGPYILGILSKESVTDLNVIEGACLSIIGLAAGAELDWPSLSRSKQQVLGITAGICIVSWLLCYAALDWVAGIWPVLPTLASPEGATVAAVAAVTTAQLRMRNAMTTLGATLMMTRSPASAIAVLKEVDGKGPYSSLVMAVVVVKDVVVICAYALNMELIRVVLLPAHTGTGLQMLNMLLPLLSVLLSMAVGAFGGLLLAVLLRPRGGAGQLLPSTTASGMHSPAQDTLFRSRQALVLGLSTTVFVVAHYFDAEPLLACVMMGMVVNNRKSEKRESGEVSSKEEFHGLVTSIMSLTNVAFFGLAGASLKLSALKDMLVPALIVAAARIVAIYLGSLLGCTVTTTSPETRRVFWASMITQAGVALGLARLAGTRFPDWGSHFQTYMMAIILINLLIGPPLFRWSLIRVGEARPAPNISPAGTVRQGGHAGSAPSTGGALLAGAKAALEAAAQDVVGEQRPATVPASHSGKEGQHVL